MRSAESEIAITIFHGKRHKSESIYIYRHETKTISI